jgi:ribosomal protein S14
VSHRDDIADSSAALKEMREDLCGAYLYIQNNLQTELKKEGLEFAIKEDRCLVTGGSAGGTSSIFMVCRGCMSSADVPGRRH